MAYKIHWESSYLLSRAKLDLLSEKSCKKSFLQSWERNLKLWLNVISYFFVGNMESRRKVSWLHVILNLRWLEKNLPNWKFISPFKKFIQTNLLFKANLLLNYSIFKMINWLHEYFYHGYQPFSNPIKDK